ncbi:MAG TPA: hypothetical protein VLH84_04305 [Patescibacteria group bacterium]|nr:hypothetical protein [Patescibacteria group bacterium]
MRYFLGFLFAIGMIIVVFVLILQGFTHHTAAPKNQISLLDYANSQTVVTLSVDGPVNADSLHRGYSITIGRDSVNMVTTQGYQGSVLQQKTYANNASSYATFLRALQLDNYTKGKTGAGIVTDERGYCATGERYVFQIIAGGQSVERFWSTSCGGGTFQGAAASVIDLFQKQVPDYGTLIQTVNL